MYIINIFEDFLGGLIGLAAFFGVFWLLAFMSKASGKTFVRHGNVVMSPDDFEHINNLPSDIIKKIKKFSATLPAKIDSLKKSEQIDKTTEKLKALKELAELKDKGILNEQEFQTMKEHILNQ